MIISLLSATVLKCLLPAIFGLKYTNFPQGHLYPSEYFINRPINLFQVKGQAAPLGKTSTKRSSPYSSFAVEYCFKLDIVFINHSLFPLKYLQGKQLKLLLLNITSFYLLFVHGDCSNDTSMTQNSVFTLFVLFLYLHDAPLKRRDTC